MNNKFKAMPEWQKKLVKKQAEKRIAKMSKEFHEKITPMMDLLVVIMESATDEEAEYLAVYMASEIVMGFEDPQQRNFVMDTIKQTVTFGDSDDS